MFGHSYAQLKIRFGEKRGHLYCDCIAIRVRINVLRALHYCMFYFWPGDLEYLSGSTAYGTSWLRDSFYVQLIIGCLAFSGDFGL